MEVKNFPPFKNELLMATNILSNSIRLRKSKRFQCISIYQQHEEESDPNKEENMSDEVMPEFIDDSSLQI